MAVEATIVYEGELRCAATHGPSGVSINTDAPTDNGGRGAAFSPTDLVGTALGSCMLTIMGLVANRHGFDLRGARVRVAKHMVADPQRRIGRFDVAFTLPPGEWTEKQCILLERAADTCPVKQSLHPNVQVNITYDYSNS